jgi:hypothetical protein
MAAVPRAAIDCSVPHTMHRPGGLHRRRRTTVNTALGVRLRHSVDRLAPGLVHLDRHRLPVGRHAFDADSHGCDACTVEGRGKREALVTGLAPPSQVVR